MSTPHGDCSNAKVRTPESSMKLGDYKHIQEWLHVPKLKPTQSVLLVGCNTLWSQCASVSVPLGGSPQSE